jgi:hypothetical protein
MVWEKAGEAELYETKKRGNRVRRLSMCDTGF